MPAHQCRARTHPLLQASLLDSDEDGAAVDGPRQARDLGPVRPGQEAGGLARHRIAHQNLVVPHAGEVAFVVVVPAGLDPDQAIAVKRDGSVCLNIFESFRKWISRSVMRPPGLLTTG